MTYRIAIYLGNAPWGYWRNGRVEPSVWDTFDTLEAAIEEVNAVPRRYNPLIQELLETRQYLWITFDDTPPTVVVVRAESMGSAKSLVDKHLQAVGKKYETYQLLRIDDCEFLMSD